VKAYHLHNRPGIVVVVVVVVVVVTVDVIATIARVCLAMSPPSSSPPTFRLKEVGGDRRVHPPAHGDDYPRQ